MIWGPQNTDRRRGTVGEPGNVSAEVVSSRIGPVMPAEDPVLFWIVVAVMIVGIAGSVIPGIPGVWMIFLVALIYGFLTEFDVIGWIPLAAIGLIAVVGTVGDIFVTGYG
ncbi:MAG: DUF456 family protein, partial [Actinobacteria bacterium]|nr:DUF456 family protein [Actinomycetota bacterium]